VRFASIAAEFVRPRNMSRWAKGESPYALLQASCQGFTAAVMDALQRQISQLRAEMLV